MNTKNYIIYCIIILFSSCASIKIEKEQVFLPQTSYPEFPGGDNKFREYLAKNTYYPEDKLKDKEGDNLIANCLIDKDGSVKNVTTISIFENKFNEEVERVLHSLPKLNPGSTREKPSAVLYVIPVNFRIPQEDEEKPFIYIEQFHEFPGGEREFEKYIKDNIKYPLINRIRNKKSELQIQFELDKVGTLKYSKVIKSISPKYDKRALEVLNNMPQWIPGSSRRHPPSVLYSLTISYDTKWILCYPKAEIKCKLESFNLSKINTNELPEDFFDDIFENTEKVRFFEPVYIIGNKY